jgi:RNA polymerase sigma-70 factor (ECF subfamily)
MVLRRCRFLLRDEELARDAMHEVFVQVVRREDRLVDQAPSSLLYRMATNVSLNMIRTRKRHPEHPDEELLQRIASCDGAEERVGARGMLARLFSGEQESTQVIAVLHLHDGLTLQEVAAEVGMSVSGVRKRLRKLREHLHELEVAA